MDVFLLNAYRIKSGQLYFIIFLYLHISFIIKKATCIYLTFKVEHQLLSFNENINNQKSKIVLENVHLQILSIAS